MTKRNSRGRPRHPDILTPAEWRVVDGVRHGLTNPQIAKRLGFSLNAVKFHISNALSKLGMSSRKDLRLWSGIAEDSAAKGRASMSNNTAPIAIGQIARTVSDIEIARQWYGSVLGITHLFDAGTLAFFECGEVRIMLTEGEAGPESVIYFRLEDLHSHIKAIEARGAKIVSAPHKIHTHDDGTEEWMGFVEDPDGRPIGLMAAIAPSQT